MGAAISAPVVRPAKLPTVAKATTASQSDIKATAAASATLGSQPENLPLGNITVCLHESDTTGNELQVWCGNQGTRFNLNMIRTTTLIREVMAVPQLHKEDPQLAAKCVEFWHFIAKKFHMPGRSNYIYIRNIGSYVLLFCRGSFARMLEILGGQHECVSKNCADVGTDASV